MKEEKKPKEKLAEPKFVKKETPAEAKKGKKNKLTEAEKPADFDEGVWEEVPKKVKPSEKKKPAKPSEEAAPKKESPAKKNKRNNKTKDADVEAARPIEEPVEETIKVVSAEGPGVDEEATRALQAQVEEVQRVFKEVREIKLHVIEYNKCYMGTVDNNQQKNKSFIRIIVYRLSSISQRF